MTRLRHGLSHLLVTGVTEVRLPCGVPKGGRVDFLAGFPNSPLISALRLPTAGDGGTVAGPTPRSRCGTWCFRSAEPTAGIARGGKPDVPRDSRSGRRDPRPRTPRGRRERGRRPPGGLAGAARR